ncbi:MAG: NAD-dependent succinate-semialdehyde dehydrogenase [Candidatus Flexifilum sp.]
MNYPFKQLINGEWVDAADGGTWDLINPATEAVIGVLPFGNARDARAAVDAAASAFPPWSRKTPYERAEILIRAATWIRARIEELARITVEESGKPLREARGEWNTGANFLEYFAEESKRAYGRIIPSRNPAKRIHTLYQPMGVIGVITAWNFPVYNPARAWAAALAAGNTVVGRPSEYTPRSAMLYAYALMEAGLPPGVLNVINGEPEPMGQVMLDDPRVRKISFTGSTRVGKLLMDGASRTVTRLALELGGNAPTIIFPDVDVERAARESIQFKFRNNGQVCIAPQRFFVHSQIVEEYTDRVATLAKAMKVGSGLDESTDVGPLINARQRDRVEALVAEAAQAGVEVLTGGARAAHPRGYFYQPTVLMGVQPGMRIYGEEIFGPVLPVIPFSDVEEVLSMANSLEYGLAAYVQTSNINIMTRMVEGLEVGMVAVNDWLPSAPEAPFGGIKMSGLGRECGSEGLLEYMELKTVFTGVFV